MAVPSFHVLVPSNSGLGGDLYPLEPETQSHRQLCSCGQKGGGGGQPGRRGCSDQEGKTNSPTQAWFHRGGIGPRGCLGDRGIQQFTHECRLCCLIHPAIVSNRHYVFLGVRTSTMARMDGSGDAVRQRGAREKTMTVRRPGSPTAHTSAVKEKERIVEEGSSSDHRMTRRRKRSRYGERPFESGVVPGLSKVVTTATALGIMLVSLVAIRLIFCFQKSMLRKAAPRSMLSGVTLRKLGQAQGPEEIELPFLAGNRDRPERPRTLPGSPRTVADVLSVCSQEVGDLWVEPDPDSPTETNSSRLELPRVDNSAEENVLTALYSLASVLLVASVACGVMIFLKKDDAGKLGPLEFVAFSLLGLDALVALILLVIESRRLWIARHVRSAV